MLSYIINTHEMDRLSNIVHVHDINVQIIQYDIYSNGDRINVKYNKCT